MAAGLTLGLVGCAKGEGDACFKNSECGEGLACIGEGLRRCEKCDGSDPCLGDGTCTAKEGACIAGSDEDCKKAAICTERGGCTAKNNKCEVGSDADCKQSTACKDQGYCVAKGNNCVKDPKAQEEPPPPPPEPTDADAGAGDAGTTDGG